MTQSLNLFFLPLPALCIEDKVIPCSKSLAVEGVGKYGQRTASKWLVPVVAEKFAALWDGLNRLESDEIIEARSDCTGTLHIRTARRSNEIIIVGGQ